MRRRGAEEKKKNRKTARAKPRISLRPRVSADDLQEQLDRRTRELHEALEQQSATSEVLRVISSSVAGLQPVFETIAHNSVNLCGATYCMVYSFDGEMISVVAHHNLDQASLDALHKLWPMRPDARALIGRTILDCDVLHVADVVAQPNYTFANTTQSVLGIRTFLGVPMLREGQPIGAIGLYRQFVKPFSDRQIDLVKAFALRPSSP
jgi:two-component system, NtrC family, sensor kinase